MMNQPGTQNWEVGREQLQDWVYKFACNVCIANGITVKSVNAFYFQLGLSKLVITKDFKPGFFCGKIMVVNSAGYMTSAVTAIINPILNGKFSAGAGNNIDLLNLQGAAGNDGVIITDIVTVTTALISQQRGLVFSGYVVSFQ